MLVSICTGSLNNACRHAGGGGQQLLCRYDGKVLQVEVLNTGLGFKTPENGSASGLGIPGLRERIESIGGELQIYSEPNQGTRIVMRCNIGGDEKPYND